MNLAFAAVVLFLIFAPGYIARRAYLAYPLSKRLTSASASDEIVVAIIPALGLHLLWLSVTYRFRSGWEPDMPLVGVLLSGAHTDPTLATAFESLQTNWWPVVYYNASLWVAAFFSGHIAQRIVRSLKLDLRVPFLRFSNEWYYLLTGRQWLLEAEWDFVWVDALVVKGTEGVIYSGRLEQFYLARDGTLEMIALAGARRTLLPAGTSAPPELGAAIPGKAFVVKYAEISNLNVTLYQLHAPEPATP